MKKEGKKWMLVAIALLAVVTVVLPLVGCKNDTVSEQTGDQSGEGEPRWLTFTSDSETALNTRFNNIDVPTDMEYSTDGKTWTAFTKEQTEISFGNGTDGKYVLYLRGRSSTGTATNLSEYVNFTFKDDTKVYASGDIRTLVDWQNPTTANTSEARFCGLFEYCTQLVTAPELPATNLATDCYNHMFRNCSDLTTAPVLPATILDYYCYFGMFSGCRNLASVTMLATNVASYALDGWLDYVANNGTLYVNSTMVNNDTIKKNLPSGKNWTVKDVKDKTN